MKLLISCNVEQFSLCLRYVLDDKIHENFVKFVAAEDRTGKGLAKLIMDELIECGLDLSYMVGQAYDGCASMAGNSTV